MSVRTLVPRSGRGKRRFGLIGAVLAALLVIGTMPGLGSSLPGSNFEIDTDANLAVGSGSSPLDWASSSIAAARVVKLDTASGQQDDSLGGSEDTACPEATSGSIQNNKSDLKEFGLYVEPGPTASHPGFLNLFWSRVQDPSGTTNLTFEFNQGRTPCTYQKGNKTVTGITPVRATGDLLITYDVATGGSSASVNLRRWQGSAWGAQESLGTDALGTINSSAITTTVAVSAINSAGNPVSPYNLGPYGARTFGEAQVDLTKIFNPNACLSFGSAYLKSRSSTSFTSTLSDYIAAQSITLTNCGRIVIQKTHAGTGARLAGAGFTVTPGKTSASGVTAASSTMTEIRTGLFCLDNLLLTQSYSIEETTVPANFVKAANLTGVSAQAGSCPAADLSQGADAGPTPQHTVANTPASGAIRIVKTRKHWADGAGDHPQSGVTFVIKNAAGATVATVVTNASGVACQAGLTQGSYTVTETVPAGYVGAPSGAQTVVVDQGGNCTSGYKEISFNNTPLTNVTVSVTSQVTGGTGSTITCKDKSDDSAVANSGARSSNPSLTMNDQRPRTLVCEIDIDP